MCAVKHLERLTLICSFDFSIVFQFLHYLNISKMGFIFIIKKKHKTHSPTLENKQGPWKPFYTSVC